MKYIYVFLKVLPGIILITGFMGCTGKPWVLSGYKSMLGVAGGTRPGMHAGVDFSGKRGDPILAAADGVVNWVEFSGGCGNGVIIYHEKFNKSTVYCHMEKTIVNYGQVIKRGEIIGYIGTTGKSMGIPHSHFEVSLDRFSHASGDVENTEDPFKYIDGCYDPKKKYPSSQFILTYPVECSEKKIEK